MAEAGEQKLQVGYRNMIADDIRLSQAMAQAVSRHADLQLMTQELSIMTFRYVPSDLRARLREPEVQLHLDSLNRELVDRLQRGGEVFISNAVVDGRYVLRACIPPSVMWKQSLTSLPASDVKWMLSCGRRFHGPDRMLWKRLVA